MRANSIAAAESTLLRMLGYTPGNIDIMIYYEEKKGD